MALPVADAATGSLNDGHQRQVVKATQSCLEYQIGKSAGQQAIGIAVGAELAKPYHFTHAGKYPPLLGTEHIGRGCIQRRIFKSVRGSTATYTPVIQCWLTLNPQPALIQRGHINDAHDGSAILKERNQTSKSPFARGETLGAINWIDHP